jgi:hypothetical protein
MDRVGLRDVIRRKLHDRALSTDRPPGKSYAGWGSRATCDACGDPIQPAQRRIDGRYLRARYCVIQSQDLCSVRRT